MKDSAQVDGSGENVPEDTSVERQEQIVPGGTMGLRLDLFVSGFDCIESRSQAKSWIQAGLVLVDGAVGKPGQQLEAGQVITVERNKGWADGASEAMGEADRVLLERGLPVLFEDDFILVINKPAGISAHPGRRGSPHPSVAEIAVMDRPNLPRTGGKDRPGIVHRLDRETSGCMVLAKQEDAYHFLKGQFKERLVQKEYRALAFGLARFDSDHINRAIGRNPRRGDTMMVVEDGGREAHTYYEVVTRFDTGQGFTHFRCKPTSGRTHQIRVHLMSIGHSLVGDKVYRSRKMQAARLPEGAPEPGRHCLHAAALSFDHPHSRERMAFSAPIPHDMQRLLDFLES